METNPRHRHGTQAHSEENCISVARPTTRLYPRSVNVFTESVISILIPLWLLPLNMVKVAERMELNRRSRVSCIWCLVHLSRWLPGCWALFMESKSAVYALFSASLVVSVHALCHLKPRQHIRSIAPHLFLDRAFHYCVH